MLIPTEEKPNRETRRKEILLRATAMAYQVPYGTKEYHDRWVSIHGYGCSGGPMKFYDIIPVPNKPRTEPK